MITVNCVTNNKILKACALLLTDCVTQTITSRNTHTVE